MWALNKLNKQLVVSIVVDPDSDWVHVSFGLIMAAFAFKEMIPFHCRCVWIQSGVRTRTRTRSQCECQPKNCTEGLDFWSLEFMVLINHFIRGHVNSNTSIQTQMLPLWKSLWSLIDTVLQSNSSLMLFCFSCKLSSLPFFCCTCLFNSDMSTDQRVNSLKINCGQTSLFLKCKTIFTLNRLRNFLSEFTLLVVKLTWSEHVHSKNTDWEILLFSAELPCYGKTPLSLIISTYCYKADKKLSKNYKKCEQEKRKSQKLNPQ